MRKVIALATVTAVLAIGFGLWAKSTGEATTSRSVSTMELHLKADPQKLPDRTVSEAY